MYKTKTYNMLYTYIFYTCSGKLWVTQYILLGLRSFNTFSLYRALRTDEKLNTILFFSDFETHKMNNTLHFTVGQGLLDLGKAIMIIGDFLGKHSRFLIKTNPTVLHQVQFTTEKSQK